MKDYRIAGRAAHLEAVRRAGTRPRPIYLPSAEGVRIVLTESHRFPDEDPRGHQAHRRRWLVLGGDERKPSPIQARPEARPRHNRGPSGRRPCPWNAQQRPQAGGLGKTERKLKMHRFLIVIEKAKRNYSAYSPDLPGCVATGKTRDQATRRMHQAIEMHVRGLREDRIPVPKSSSTAEYIALP